ncbi:MAG: Do family serine endopeptidase [Alphaproteobacteria bacterium]|nr:Do family serine endopeptidase [Alphaproteobacteria bacterium]
MQKWQLFVVTKTTFQLCCLVALLMIMSSSIHAHDPAQIPDIVERVLPAVVNISTTGKAKASKDAKTSAPSVPNLPEGSPFREFFEEFFAKDPKTGKRKRRSRPRKVQSLGSGFIIDAAGLVVTNYHVIADADEITVGFSGGTKLKAKIVGTDAKTDLAVLKVEPVAPLTSVAFGDSKTLRVGEQVIAIGNPFGLGGTVSLGVVSAKNRDINAGSYDDFIQSDAAVNRGNNGGPMFNLHGEVVGVNTSIISPSGGSIGIGFAVPSSTAKNVVAQLRQFGETRRGTIGVRIQTVTDEVASAIGLAKSTGALINEVIPGRPAEQAGLKKGDVLLRWNGVEVPQMRALPGMVAGTPPGSVVDAIIFRDGERLAKKVTVARLEESSHSAASPDSKATNKGSSQILSEIEWMGVTLTALTRARRAEFKIEPKVTAGVVVTNVHPESDAAEQKITPGDVIAELGKEKVSSLGDVVKSAAQLEKDGRPTVLVLISNRRGDVRFIGLKKSAESFVKRFVGAGTADNPSVPLSLADVQRMLADLGYDPGPIDGKMGGKTKVAIRKFQTDQGQSSDGLVSSRLAKSLRAALKQRAAVKNEANTNETDQLGDLDDLDTGSSQ